MQFIAITLGDPAGIGPEIVVKSLSDPKVYEVCQPLVIGDKSVIKHALTICQQNADIHVVEKPQAGKYQRGTIDLIECDSFGLIR